MRRILTIDGGGIKGVFPAAFLATLEQELGGPVADYFDLIAGTSTGGIIAIGLGLGFSAQHLLDLYKVNGAEIFPKKRLLTWKRLVRAKYTYAPLRRALVATFGEQRLGESRKRLLIPSLNLAAERVHSYKTSHHPKLVHDYKLPVVEVALATVAAPTYFPIHLSPDGLPYIDGSLWARNPLALAVTEAIGVLDWPRDQISVLSLGCTSEHLNVSWQKRISLGASYWGARIGDVFMKAQSSSAIATAHALVGEENVVRISPDIGDRHFSLDGVENMPELEALGRSEAATHFAGLAAKFFAAPVEPFHPSHTLADWDAAVSAAAIPPIPVPLGELAAAT
ncbi:MAG TPA: CBASS cGAMP-activated phospholipase [Stellaceae bacterium]|nr:CBASS cGAMP-activated phospholipase [Stellaceae bacterium]